MTLGFIDVCYQIEPFTGNQMTATNFFAILCDRDLNPEPLLADKRAVHKDQWNAAWQPR